MIFYHKRGKRLRWAFWGHWGQVGESKYYAQGGKLHASLTEKAFGCIIAQEHKVLLNIKNCGSHSFEERNFWLFKTVTTLVQFLF